MSVSLLRSRVLTNTFRSKWRNVWWRRTFHSPLSSLKFDLKDGAHMIDTGNHAPSVCVLYHGTVFISTVVDFIVSMCHSSLRTTLWTRLGSSTQYNILMTYPDPEGVCVSCFCQHGTDVFLCAYCNTVSFTWVSEYPTTANGYGRKAPTHLPKQITKSLA